MRGSGCGRGFLKVRNYWNAKFGSNRISCTDARALPPQANTRWGGTRCQGFVRVPGSGHFAVISICWAWVLRETGMILQSSENCLHLETVPCEIFHLFPSTHCTDGWGWVVVQKINWKTRSIQLLKAMLCHKVIWPNGEKSVPKIYGFERFLGQG